jgi:Rrf2 family protein
MIELAQHDMNQPLQLKIIAERQEISIKYLEQLMAILKSAGLIKSIRGSKGGYVLARAPNRIVISDILHCVEGPIATVECVDDKNSCSRAAECAAREVWVRVEQAIENVLRSISLQDVAEMASGTKQSYYQI